jgi:hypothetical protein
MQPDHKTQPLGAAKLTVLHWRRHSLFAAQVMMALTVVVLLALTIAGAENLLFGWKRHQCRRSGPRLALARDRVEDYAAWC